MTPGDPTWTAAVGWVAEGLSESELPTHDGDDEPQDTAPADA